MEREPRLRGPRSSGGVSSASGATPRSGRGSRSARGSDRGMTRRLALLATVSCGPRGALPWAHADGTPDAGPRPRLDPAAGPAVLVPRLVGERYIRDHMGAEVGTVFARTAVLYDRFSDRRFDRNALRWFRCSWFGLRPELSAGARSWRDSVVAREPFSRCYHDTLAVPRTR